MAYLYRRSETIDVLKHTDEKIKENYSSEQYLSALDTLLSYAIKPVIMSSNFVDTKLADLLVSQVKKPTTKFSIHKKEGLFPLLTEFLTTHDPSIKLSLYMKMGLHRNYTIQYVSEWLALLDTYVQDYLQDKDVSAIETLVYHNQDHASLFASVRQSAYWIRYAKQLRDQILQKYHRLIVNESVFLYKVLSHSVDLDDLTQVLTQEALRALDRCNIEKGPITSYLQRYLRFSGAQINFEYDSAYTVHGKRKDYAHKSVELQDDSIEQSATMQVFTEVDNIRQLARILDPTGVGRYLLGIEEYIPAIKA